MRTVKRAWVPLAVAATALALVTGPCSTSGAAVAPTGKGTAAAAHLFPTPAPHPAVPGPRGWQAGDFGRARLWVPPSWTVWPASSGLRCRPGGGALLLGAGPFTTAPRGCAPVVRLARYARPPIGATARRVNGYRALTTAGPGSDLGRWWVPALGVTFVLPTGTPAAVLRTLGPSPQGIVTEGGPLTPVPHGWHAVRYAGVQIEVPASWPTASGDLTAPCGQPFAHRAAAYIGTDQGSPFVSCPVPPAVLPARPGVWLLPGRPVGLATVPLRLPSGVTVLEAKEDNGPLLLLWSRGTEIQLGIGAAPFAARAMLDSLADRPGAPSTVVTYACPAQVQRRMPQPARLATHLLLAPADGGGFSLAPPRPGQQPRAGARAAWRHSGPPEPGVRYRIFLARLTDQQAGGQRGTLVWSVYGVPHVTRLGLCAPRSVWFTNATTGRQIEGAYYD